MTCYVRARRGFYFLKNSICVFSAPAGAFIFPKSSVFVFSAPAGAFILLKKSIFVLNTPPGDGPGTTQGRPGAGGGRGPAGEGKVWFGVHETILWDTAANPPGPPDPPDPT